MMMPVRTAPKPQSIASNPVYQLLYANDGKALTNFAFHRKFLAYEDLQSKHEFLVYVMKQERGPTVDYKGISANLSTFRVSMGSTPTGFETLKS